jgi:hypothetical protein
MLNKTVIHGRIDGPLLLEDRTHPAFARRPHQGCFWVVASLEAASDGCSSPAILR